MKKVIATFLAGVMLTSSLAGCSGNTSSSVSSGPNLSSEQTTQLTYWYWADNTEQSDLMKSIVKQYNETNDKNILVTAEEYPWDSGGFTDSIFTAIMGGGGPDLSTFKLQAGKNFAANHLLADMSSYVEAWQDKSQINDGIWQMMKASTGDEKLSVLPWTLEALYVYYRPSYFKKAGIEKAPTTFDEFLDAIKKTTMDTNGDGKTDVYGLGLRGAGGGHEHLGSFLYAYGANWDDLTTPQAIEAYKAYLNIFKSGYAPDSAPNAAYAETVDGFKSGLTAMIIHHIGSSAIWSKTFGDDVAAFPIPAGKGGQWTCTGDTCLTVYEQCENKEAAFDFYQYMTTGEGGTTWFKSTGKGLGTKNVVATSEYKDNKFQTVAAESLKHAGVLPPTDTLTEFINSTWANTNQQALLGQISAEDALKIMQKSLHAK